MPISYFLPKLDHAFFFHISLQQNAALHVFFYKIFEFLTKSTYIEFLKLIKVYEMYYNNQFVGIPDWEYTYILVKMSIILDIFQK